MLFVPVTIKKKKIDIENKVIELKSKSYKPTKSSA